MIFRYYGRIHRAFALAKTRKRFTHTRVLELKMSDKGQCFYLRPAMYTLAILGGLVLVVALFGGFEPAAVAAR